MVEKRRFEFDRRLWLPSERGRLTFPLALIESIRVIDHGSPGQTGIGPAHHVHGDGVGIGGERLAAEAAGIKSRAAARPSGRRAGAAAARVA
jgi:hypothetical protein